MTHRTRISRRAALQATALGLASLQLPALRAAGTRNVFEPTWDSLISQYRAPEWFRDAKFGIWAHWSAQCVPEFGDWYARKMYVQGDPAYDHHVAKYGHPSTFGFMEFDNLWKAERWDPEALMQLYVTAGAKYFVSLANHHDNFDAYDSKHHAWNSVRIGPKRDIVGTWARVARAHGLRFGVSNHSAHAWHWFQTAYGYDGEGAHAGVRYDAARLTRADGKGTWWDGLDPQELYTGPNIRMPDGLRGIAAVKDWHQQHTRPWTEAPPTQNPEFTRRWLLRCQDLVDKYRPDLLYFDNFDLPLGQAGLDMAAYYYNANRDWHAGKLEAVINVKQLPPERRAAVVDDIERGGVDELRDAPWQTDTCLGDWHYNRAVFDRHGYKSALSVVRTLVDTVSKNGNLLLSVPMRGDGTIDSDERKVLEELAAWMKVNGEAIHGTRPWRLHGEGPTKPAGGMFQEKAVDYTAKDLRFTRKGDAVYVAMLGVQDVGEVTIEAMASGGSGGEALRVEMLGAGGTLPHRRTAAGLQVTLPSSRAKGVVGVLKVSGV
jgi:alpha-L-fucosidase